MSRHEGDIPGAFYHSRAAAGPAKRFHTIAADLARPRSLREFFAGFLRNGIGAIVPIALFQHCEGPVAYGLAKVFLDFILFCTSL